MTIASQGSLNRSVANCLDIIFGTPRLRPLSPLISSISESLHPVLPLDIMLNDQSESLKKLAPWVELLVSAHAAQSEPWRSGGHRVSAATFRGPSIILEISISST